MAIGTRDRTDVNRSAVLAQLGGHPASRADLARALRVSPALMTQLVKELLNDGLVMELEHSPSHGGRPARLLGLVTTAGRSVGLKIAPDHIAFVDVGLDGAVIRSWQEPFDPFSPTLLEELGKSVASFIDQGDGLPVIGVGVAVAGTVDSQASGVVDSYQLGWNKVPVGPTLRRVLNLPVLVENNVNALAIAERLFGLGREFDNFLTVTIGTGVGAAIVMDGAVLRGGAGGAGELGHVPVDPIGAPCNCGNRGCLETVISEHALVTKAREREIIGATEGIGALTTAADGGDERAWEIFSEAGYSLARVLAGVVQVFDPTAIVLLGEGTSAWAHWSRGFEPAFRGALLPDRRGVPVTVEEWNDVSWAQGAAALVLSTPFDSDGVAGDQGKLVRSRLSDLKSLEGAAHGR